MRTDPATLIDLCRRLKTGAMTQEHNPQAVE